MINFTNEQKAELKSAATWLVRSRKWRELSWDAAWSGVYPETPSELEIDEEYEILVAKALRIIEYGLSASETKNLEEQARTIALEFCEKIKI